MQPTDTSAPLSTTPGFDRVAHLEDQARRAEATLYTLFLDYDDCTRRGLHVDLPPAVANAMLEYHPFAERMRTRVRTQLQVLNGLQPEPLSREAQNAANRRMWLLEAEDVPEIVLTKGHRTNVDWVVAVVASAPKTPWTAAQVLEVLERNGWSTSSPNPQNLIANTLARALTTHPHLQRCGRGTYTWQLTESSAADELPGDLPGESRRAAQGDGASLEEAAMS
ncbi:hypothetical protein [Quadrisphaera sp. INWT6]|uniref:hypothetical protein n=1 Tax=Quadrisphaera sp. INWT6 TaxID=2596917 RepID=UPI0018922773|nr:hypothetical protein [Quadrisphaera sp. INWT6]MBF5081389.1 hypothetical protein [Quadrisphaera sp. INWT6]